jgi:Holliday junction resolvase
MSNDLGKQFEDKFKSDWKKSFPDGTIIRLYDQMSGYKTVSQNICDFIGYARGTLFLMECKTIKGNTFPFSNLKQYEKLLAKKNIKGVKAGVVIWFYEKDTIMFVPIEEAEKMITDGEKSVNCKKVVDNMYEKCYSIIQIPGIKKRVFIDSDYSVLLQ